MNLLLQPPQNVAIAHNRIKQYINLTPIIHSESLNAMLGHEIFFKVESLQKTGAFKIRGVLNNLLKLKEQEKLPDKIVCYSSGNHGIGLAYSSKLFGIKTRIYLPLNTSKVKQQAALYYGGEVIYTNTRQEAESRAKADEEQGFYYMHPSDSDSIIAGAGTLCYEALQQLGFSPDAIFASCGGGGLISGSYLAKELISPTSLLIGSEPVAANDAYLSIKNNNIYRFNDSPITIADGLKTLSVSARTFEYLKKLDHFYLAEEYEIYYWTAWLTHLLKVICEPSSSINMASVVSWLKTQTKTQKLLVLISGGNIDPTLYNELWKNDYLTVPPSISN
ncbi:serine/threonine dehydratase [Rickettsia prowazekii]|uniref:THREONINE DEHYDRATASE (TdcB) n=2 Tax=Rickettsia prowazekii TaxID=782 RepID=Q9ZD93_RICPR|nr:serine/threonine dehydratase [Rickettsia prowazekii]EOB09816.1 Threonine dehydratase [Rickettsia prowazekii str. GvF12]ADE29979.1 Threonine dehydratase [Rickettsia prowazekii str. Rp22]AFE49262.1 threonine dehydratase [Rickettsia prowazekii str. Chernikova]AFE50108.1 threonine dehydratase [Rickettsia prowazekii str. Katsinyian]AFE50953.1 threonine dehydratase [Rickettsia prowazekii str. BuV67-CWPP]